MREPGYIELALALSPLACATLEPLVRQAADDEIDSDQVRTELANLANELRAGMQRVARQGRAASG